jgi:drug/metabolite transporter (DMT)-like permease
MTPRALLVLALVGVIWGTSYLFIRIAIEEVSPLQYVFFRSIGGAAALLLIALLQRRAMRINRRQLGFALVLAVVGSLIPFLLIGLAEQDLESGPAAVLNATMPLFVVVFATALVPEERLSPVRALGIAVGLAGVVILVGRDALDVADSKLLAQAAMLASSAFYAGAALISRVALKGWNPAAMSTWQITLLALMATPLTLALEPPSFDLAWDTWLALLSLGVLSTGVAYIAYYWLIENVGSVRASLVAYILPVVGVVAGAIVLDEVITWNTLAGGGVILAGLDES